VTDLLDAALTRLRAAASDHGVADPSVTVAACGPMAMLAAVTRQSAANYATGVRVEVAVEEQMACGIGVCMTCVIPVMGEDGITRMTRTCTAGPVLDAATVRWDAVTSDGSSVPDDAWGAPAMAGR